MLKTLTVWNFALIEHISINFNNGLNILTGETGAGKSILIDSVGVILGYRTPADNIRCGCEWLRVEAVFDIAQREDISQFLVEHGIIDDEDTLIISRRITQNSKNTITINGCHVTLTVLRSLGEILIDIHGQHENQKLLKAEKQFALIDEYNAEIKTQLVAYRELLKKWRDFLVLLNKKQNDSREQEQRLDMLRWQIDEIASAQLKENEDEKLETEIKVLSNIEKVADLAKRSYVLLEEGDKNHKAIIPSLVELKKNMEAICRYDNRANNSFSIITETLCQLEECSYDIRNYVDAIDYSPEKLVKMQDRMDVIYKLRKKYGATISDVLQHYKDARAELNEIENYDQLILNLKENIKEAELAMLKAAKKLTALRTITANKLADEICVQLHQLGMTDAKFKIEVHPLTSVNQNGADDVVMMFSANAGENLKIMQKVVSGGELSRIALAIKTVCAEKDKIDVMIFDEIDTGIGGKTAQMVAERIAMIAKHRQVLCITHLPQIACMADMHLYIDKHVCEGKTITQVKPLSISEQIDELARMASGNDVTSASLDNALEMLNNAKKKKENWNK